MRLDIFHSLWGTIRGQRKAQKWILLGGLCIALIGAGALVLRGMENRTAKEVTLKILTDEADVHIQNAHYTEVGEGGTVWEIDAESVRFVRKENLAYFDKVRIQLTLKDGNSYVMTGDKGELRTDTKNAELRGGVAVTSSRGWRLDTEALKYRDADQVIQSEKDVRLKSPKLEIQGVGMAIHLKTEEVRLSSKVNAVLW
jgi:LPS export ABC transporter protein LptC